MAVVQEGSQKGALSRRQHRVFVGWLRKGQVDERREVIAVVQGRGETGQAQSSWQDGLEVVCAVGKGTSEIVVEPAFLAGRWRSNQ